MKLRKDQKIKRVKQFKLQLNGVLKVFDIHGLGVYITDVKEIVTELALLLHESLDGEETPVSYEEAQKRLSERYTRK